MSEIAHKIVEYTCDCQNENFNSALSSLQFLTAVHFIDDNITRKIEPEEVSSHISFNVQRFISGFEEEAGDTFSDYHMQRRPSFVQEWLKGKYSDISNEEIARKIGFETARELDLAFLKHVGISIQSYRKEKPI